MTCFNVPTVKIKKCVGMNDSTTVGFNFYRLVELHE